MSKDFKIEVIQRKEIEDYDYFEYNSNDGESSYQSHQDNLVVIVCLRCVNPSCLSIINQLNEEYDFDERIDEQLCLIKLKLTIYSTPQTFEFEDRKGRLHRVSYKASLNDFYNNVTKYGRGIGYLNNKLKNGGKALFSILLYKAIQSNILNDTDNILVEASGDLEHKDMKYLINYYEMMGFEVLDKSTLKHQLDSKSVMMAGSVENVFHNSMTDNISPELKDVINDLLRSK